MKKKKLILAALAASLFIPSIVTPVNAADEEMEEIQVEMKEEGSPRLTVEVATPEEFHQAIKNDQTITLTADITLEGCVTINGIKNITIDLNNHTLSGNGKGNKSRGTQIKDSDVVIKNGNLKSIHKNGVVILGHSNVEIINCQVTTNEQDTFVISTNASVDPSTKVLVKESTIGTAQDVNGRGFSAYFPEGVVEILDSTVNGHMSISGGDVTIKGGTFNATGFGGQTYIYNEQETIEHLEKNVIPTSQLNNGMISTGEPVFIIDRRSDSYNLKRVTIEGVAFNTKIDLSGVEEVVHAIKYVDLNSKSSAARSVSKPAQIILKNNTYNHLPKETGPNMFIRRPESIGTHPNEIQEYTSIFVTEKGDSVEAGANRTVVSQNSTVTIESGSVTLNDSDKSIVKKTKLSPAILADEAVFHKIAEILGNSFVANPQDNIKIVATPELRDRKSVV